MKKSTVGIWVWTKKTEEIANELSLEERKENTPAQLGNDLLGKYAPIKWVEKGYVKELISFDDLCDDFHQRKPMTKPTNYTFWFSDKEWINGNDSVRSILNKHLKKNNIQSLDDLQKLWFLYNGQWTTFDYKVENNIISYYMAEFN